MKDDAHAAPSRFQDLQHVKNFLREAPCGPSQQFLFTRVTWETGRFLLRSHGSMNSNRAFISLPLRMWGNRSRIPSCIFRITCKRGITLLSSLLQAGVRRFVFSSTCAIYREPESLPIKEDFLRGQRVPTDGPNYFWNGHSILPEHTIDKTDWAVIGCGPPGRKETGIEESDDAVLCDEG
jgi:hypothetical protein